MVAIIAYRTKLAEKKLKEKGVFRKERKAADQMYHKKNAAVQKFRMEKAMNRKITKRRVKG